MGKVINLVIKYSSIALNVLLAVCLSLMGIFLFANIVLRYFFNSGLPWSDELARFMFVWITFMGAIGALKDQKHLGFTTVIKKLPRLPKLICYLISNVIVLVLLYMVFFGSIAMAGLGWHNLSPAMGIPLTFKWIAGTIMAFIMFIIIAVNVYKAVFIPDALDSLINLEESEDELKLEDVENADKFAVGSGDKS